MEQAAVSLVVAGGEAIEIPPEARERLVARLQEPFAPSREHLLEALSDPGRAAPVELDDRGKADLVETLTFWVEEVGRDALPPGLGELRDALLDDLDARGYWNR